MEDMVAVLQLRFELFYFRKPLNLHKITRGAAILLLSGRDFCFTLSDSIVHVMPSNLATQVQEIFGYVCPSCARTLLHKKGHIS